MTVRLAVVLSLLVFSNNLFGQVDTGAGQALSFDGIHDYVILGNVYDDLQLPVTISAWIYLDPRGLGTIFASQDNSHLYSGFHFYAVFNALIIEYGDGLGISPEYRRGKSGPIENIFGRWVHVAAVMRGAQDMDLFLNGINLGGTYFGQSELPMKSALPSELAKIGYRSPTGVTYHFQGIMDELRLWNRPLSESEIREQMCKKLTGLESGLIGYWDFNEVVGNILRDKSRNHVDGQVQGNPRLVFSGAPIGDTSVLIYTQDWQDKELTLRDSEDHIRVSRVTGNPEGMHIYEVKELPSQTGGLNLSTVTPPYFGVFVAGDNKHQFDVNYAFKDSAVCKLFTRPDNSVQSWTKNSSFLSQAPDRIELIKQLHHSSPKVDLGPDEALCSFEPRLLVSLKDTIGFDFLWQDGSTFSRLITPDFGTYWVNVGDGCSLAVDTLRLTRVDVDGLEIPTAFTPNGDPVNQYFEIDRRLSGGWLVVYNRWGKEVFQSSHYANDWDGADLPAGTYFYRLQGGECIEEQKGVVSIVR